MPRRGRRHTVERGIARDGTGYAVYVSVGSGTARRTRERRFPLTVDLPYLRAQRAQLEADLRDELQQRDPQVRPARGTFGRDVRTYLKRVRAQLDPATHRSRASEMAAWVAAVGSDQPRHHIRRADVERILGDWRAKVSAKTILNRVRSLRHLYRLLDGPHAKTPADGVALPRLVRQRPRPVDRATLRTVVARLIKQERRGRLRDAKTRARFLVLVTTGQRPSQLRTTVPRDVDLEKRIWWVPAGKGGEPVPLYLNDDMLRAWRLFVAARAWGGFDGRSFARTIRAAGWPEGHRIYAGRHSVGIALSEQGTDLADIQAFLGHRWIQTTRDFYVPALFSRLKRASESLEGRVGLSRRMARYAGTHRKEHSGVR